MKIRWYDWPWITIGAIVLGIPIAIYVAASDAWDGWRYRD